MKKIILLTLLFVFACVSSIQALSWAYAFVVWDGKLYEVIQDEPVADSDISQPIGKVTTAADDMTGDYYGNASNYYEAGTVYYAINGVETEDAIALEVNGEYLRAVYRQEAQFHFMNIFLDGRFWFFVVIVLMAIIYITLRVKRRRKLSP